MTTSSVENQDLSSLQIETLITIMGVGWMRGASMLVLIPSFIYSLVRYAVLCLQLAELQGIILDFCFPF